MTEHKAQPGLSLEFDSNASLKSERHAMELKVAELSAAAESFAQRIAIAQGQMERLDKQVEDYRRFKQQAEVEFQSIEQLNAERRREIHKLDMEIKVNEAAIGNQQERAHTLAETIEIAEKRNRQIIDASQAETDLKLKGIRHEFDLERERLTIDLTNHRNRIQTEMQEISEEWEQIRKKQQRTLEIEAQDARKKIEETVAKTLQEGRGKNEALIKATEATALEVHRESEAAAKRLLAEATQKAADIIRAAHLEAEEVRRRTHNAEVSFLKEKNSGLAELKLMVNNAKDEAQKIISAATRTATDIQYKSEQENEARIAALNHKMSLARKTAEKETQEVMEQAKAAWTQQATEHAAGLARRVKETEEQINLDRRRMEEEARTLLGSARERAQAIVETANHEKNYKFEELKALESSMFQSARQSASSITQEAENIALNIVEEARGRAHTVEMQVDDILERANGEATKIKSAAIAYAEKVKREVPNPADWEAEITRMRQQEQARLQALVEPTVMKYLEAIDMSITNLFVELPSKYQSNKVIHDFAQAISNIQQRKSQIKFSDLVLNASVGSGQPLSQAPLKKSS